ncbi:MAG: hypothetical protein Kow0092_29260 [Deferrisomatales bacterium]
MDAVTYPQPAVGEFVSTRLVPVRVPHDAQPWASRFRVQWTPTLVTLGPEGEEHHRTVGFLPPEELVASLSLAIAKCHFDAQRFGEALEVLDRLLREHPETKAVPEAIYYRGVAAFKHTNDPAALRAAYDRLAADHPSSEWAQRAEPYRLIEPA